MAQEATQHSSPGGSARVVPAQVARRLQDVFSNSPYAPLRQVSCEYHEGAVTLHGRVPSFYLKQLAQTIVRKVEQVEQVINRIEVVDQLAPPSRHVPRRAR